MSGWLQDVTTFVTLLCYVTLLFYLVKAVSVMIPPKDEKRRLPEALAVIYLLAASWFTVAAVAAIPRFAMHCVDVTSYLFSVPVVVIQLVAMAATLIVTAFICNFSRSLYMLKSLDHGIFEPVPDWKQRLEQDFKGLLEFSTRLAAAFLFLVLEFQLEAVGHATSVPDQEAALASNHFAVPASVGLLLYVVLICWWLVGKSIAGEKMPMFQLWFYVAGLANSVVLWAYSQRAESGPWAWVMVISALVSFIPSLYMLSIVLHDIVVDVRRIASRRVA